MGDKRPPWLDKKISLKQCSAMKSLLADLALDTICQRSLCPNIGDCFSSGHATFLLLGAICTRGCLFCNVTGGTPESPDAGEPARVAEAAVRLGLGHVVVTSVTRDDLPDGGAAHFARTIKKIRGRIKGVRIETLIPDFAGDEDALKTVAGARPDIIGHNIETVPRLYREVRRGASYRRSLNLLRKIKEIDRRLRTKSGLMLGMGERPEEVMAAMKDLRQAGCDFLSLGQYIAPSERHYAVREYLPPSRFDEYRSYALQNGFTHVESAPYVRSSYHARRYLVAHVV
jgi:lipoic acid synthetase